MSDKSQLTEEELREKRRRAAKRRRERERRRKRRNRIILAAVLALIVLAVAVFAINRIKSRKNEANSASTPPAASTETTAEAVNPAIDDGEDTTPSVTPEPTAPPEATEPDAEASKEAEVPNEAPVSTETIYATDTVNIREQPNTDCTVIGQAKRGDSFERTADENGWSTISYNGQTAYMSSEFVTTVKPERVTWELSELDASPVNFGYAQANRDERNIPTDWKYYEDRWGQFDVDWIGDTSKNVIYLTMDEGFSNETTIPILNTLEQKGVPVTFFITKYFADARPDLVKAILDHGHQIGNHSCTHPQMPTLSIEDQTSQVMTLHNQIRDQYGYEMKAFRYPEGVYSAQSLGLVNNLGYKVAFWSYAYNDYDNDHQPDVGESLQKALDAVHPGAIYLLHASSTTNAAMLADFIDGVRAKGFEFGVYPLA